MSVACCSGGAKHIEPIDIYSRLEIIHHRTSANLKQTNPYKKTYRFITFPHHFYQIPNFSFITCNTFPKIVLDLASVQLALRKSDLKKALAPLAKVSKGWDSGHWLTQDWRKLFGKALHSNSSFIIHPVRWFNLHHKVPFPRRCGAGWPMGCEMTIMRFFFWKGNEWPWQMYFFCTSCESGPSKLYSGRTANNAY